MHHQNSNGSTGPRTAEGKQRSSSNARKHGFTGRKFIVAAGEEQEFETFLNEWENDLTPEGAVEAELFGQIIHAAWTLRRLDNAEAALLDDSPGSADPLLSDSAAIQNKLRLYSIYKGRAERSQRQGLADLRRIQEERLIRAVILEEDHSLPLLPRAAVLRQQVARDKRTHAQQQRADIEAYINAPMPGQTKSTVPK